MTASWGIAGQSHGRHRERAGGRASNPSACRPGWSQPTVPRGRAGSHPRRSWSVGQAADAPCATSLMTVASSCGRDHIGQWLVGRST